MCNLVEVHPVNLVKNSGHVIIYSSLWWAQSASEERQKLESLNQYHWDQWENFSQVIRLVLMEMQQSSYGDLAISTGLWKHTIHYHNFARACKSKSSNLFGNTLYKLLRIWLSCIYIQFSSEFTFGPQSEFHVVIQVTWILLSKMLFDIFLEYLIGREFFYIIFFMW